jgi:hypothetical protein
MKKGFREYKRPKKPARVMEGDLRPEVIQDFLDKLDEEKLTNLKVTERDLKKLKKAEPEEQLRILVPYFENYFQQMAHDKLNQKLNLAQKISQTISNHSKHKSGRIEMPHLSLLMLANLIPGAFICLENGKESFIYPLSKLKQILSNLEAARIVWDTETNLVRIVSAEDSTRFYFKLYPQEYYLVQDKMIFNVKLDSRSQDFSITGLLLKAAESILNI